MASGINAVAGGGTLISFPILIAFGLPAKAANATNSVALWPGSLAGAMGFRSLWPQSISHLKLLAIPTILGSAVGSLLLIFTSQKMFDNVIPALILAAALLLLFQDKVKAMVFKEGRSPSPLKAVIIQFAVSLYGGYFGAGMGIMMLAAFALFIEGSIHELNAIKNWLGLLINLSASIIFIWKGLVVVGPAIAVACGSIVGGFLAATWSQRVDPKKLRFAVAVYGLVMAIYFLLRTLKLL